MVPEITSSLVTSLILQQFPQWANLPIIPVEQGGHDNRTFRLGDDMLVRLPSGEGYAAQVQKEQTWLPKLAQHLSCAIPAPIAMGQPSENYPYNWSVYKWIEGESANALSYNEDQLQPLAVQLAEFLNELRRIDTSGAPPAGLHNYHRGDSPAAYDSDARKNIKELSGIIDANAAIAVWEKAVSSKWDKNPVWVHGDFASGNLLVKDGKLAAAIDFGCIAVGDPSCDLVIAWTFLKGESRAIFKERINLDADTWARARGWALWKACFEFLDIKDKTNPEAKKHLQIIESVINEHNGSEEICTHYDKIINWFDNARTKTLMEKEYLDLCLKYLKPGANILDLGCGTGEPIAKFFIENGMHITGIDGASNMIALCKQRFPKMEWQVGDMRQTNLSRKFDAIITWDSFFHLPRNDQRKMFAIFRAHIADRGILVFTTGTKDGEVYSTMDGQRFYHASLDLAEYRALLEEYGFTVLLNKVEDPDCGEHTVWVCLFTL